MSRGEYRWENNEYGESYPLSPHSPPQYRIETGYTGHDAVAGFQSYDRARSPTYSAPGSRSIIRKPTQGHPRNDSFSRRAQRSSYSNISNNDYENAEPIYSSMPQTSPPSHHSQSRSVSSIQQSNYVPRDSGAIQRSLPSTVESNYSTYHSEPAPKLVEPSVHAIYDEDSLIVGADATLNRIISALRIKQAFHRLSPRTFHPKAVYQFQAPHSYQLPDRHGGSIRSGIFRHLDVFHRGYKGLDDDQYLDPLDGRVRRLIVQATGPLYDAGNDTTWRRTYMRNVSPLIIRLAWWPYARLPYEESTSTEPRTLEEKIKVKRAMWNSQQWTGLCLRWLPACTGLLLLMIFPTDVEGQVRNHGFYDPVPYRFWSYPKSARNYYENQDTKSAISLGHTKDERLATRWVMPRYLCFLDQISEQNPRGLVRPEDWVKEHGGEVQPKYIFVSYTAEKQFERPCALGLAEVKKNGFSTCTCSACESNRFDADALHRIAIRATQNAEVPAYWTDACCMSRESAAKFSEDVYRIADVVRACHRFVIVVGRTGSDILPPGTTTLSLLKEWASRMWTWPEIMLAPIGKTIEIYTRDSRNQMPLEIAKLNFVAQVFDDTDVDVARQLIDHYDSSLTLSRLELVVLALTTLKSRATTKFFEGDLSYALMGLLRQRPMADATDTAFQAFARLSLANDSDRLLERVICLLPTYGAGDKNLTAEQRSEFRRHYWTDMSDRWGAKLWDIEPYCQVAGIADSDTVIIDGAYGASIHWDTFQRVAITTRETWSRMLGRFCVRGTPVWFMTGVLTVSFARGDPSSTFFGAILLIISLTLVLLSPILMLHIYSGKVWNSQPWLFGFEGHLPLRAIEQKIFGFPCKRLAWAPYSSHLSQHHVRRDVLADECEGIDPFGEGVGQLSNHDGSMRLFTIVDTMTMTVSMFYAPRPPVVALLCGSEGGMQRALMCSYDWTTQALYRESVLRMETRMLERMPRIGRVRFGLTRWHNPPPNVVGEV